MHPTPYDHELQYGLSDLVALSAFPGLLTDDEPAKLAEHLAELLLSTLRLDLAYACVRDQSGGVHETTRADPLYEHALLENRGHYARHALSGWEHWHDGKDGAVQHGAAGLRVVKRSIELQAEWGIIGAASQRLTSPRH